MGVEYIISAKLFAGLPEREKALWHSHVHEVKSGQLIAPGIPEVAEHELMEKLIHTYGKTWHTWHTDLDKDLPRGMPQLMMGFTADGQASPAMIAARDARLGVSSEDKRKRRADIPQPAPREQTLGRRGGRSKSQTPPGCTLTAAAMGSRSLPVATRTQRPRGRTKVDEVMLGCPVIRPLAKRPAAKGSRRGCRSHGLGSRRRRKGRRGAER